MKNKIFSKGLYLEGLRQLKLVGIISSVIVCVLAAIIPVGSGISMMSMMSMRESADIIGGANFYRETVSGVAMNPFLFLVFLVLAPLLALILFGFLNKRRTSDFYHSIPHTRLSVFFSFTAAIMTWVAIMIVSSSLAAGIGYLIFIKYFLPLYTDLLLFMLSALIVSFLAVSAVAIAASITGTPFSNFLFTAMILLLPRFLITFVNSIMFAQTPILYSGSSFFLFGSGYNLYATAFISVFDGMNTFVSYYLSAKGMLYTLVLGLIYLAVAAWLFVRRKSESAERSAPSRRLQTVYRTLVTMAFCMIPCLAIFTIVTGGSGFYAGDIFILVVLYILALILYFAYELITTRKWKNLLRAMPWLGLVVACNLAVIGALLGVRAIHLSFTPSENEITGVSVIYENNDYYSYREMSYGDYVNSQMNEVVLNSPEVNRIIADGLKNSVNALKRYGADDYYRYGNPYYSSDKEDGGLYEMTFRITTKTGSRARTIKLSIADIDTINNLLVDNEQYYDLWTKLPDPAAYDLRFTTTGMYYTLNALSAENQKEITKLLQEEIAQMGFEAWYKLVSENNREYYDYYVSDVIGYISYPIKTDRSSINYYRLPISYEKMPKTSAFILKLYSQDEAYRGEAVATMEKVCDARDDWDDAFIYAYLPQSDGSLKAGYLTYHFYSSDGRTFADGAKAILAKVKSGAIAENEPFALLSVYDYTEHYNSEYGYYDMEMNSYCVFVPLSGITWEELEEYGFTESSDSGYYEGFYWD